MNTFLWWHQQGKNEHISVVTSTREKFKKWTHFCGDIDKENEHISVVTSTREKWTHFCGDIDKGKIYEFLWWHRWGKKSTHFGSLSIMYSSDNSSLKYWRSEFGIKTLFPFFQGSAGISNGSHQMPWDSRNTHRDNTGHDLSRDPTKLHFTIEERSSNQNIETAISSAIPDFRTYLFKTWLALRHRPKFWCILVINTYSSNLARLSNTVAANVVHMESI